MQVPVFLLEIQHVKQLKSVFLKIYNCAWKVAVLKSGHIYLLIKFLKMKIGLKIMLLDVH